MRKFLKFQTLVFFLMTCSNAFLFGQDITITNSGEKEEIYFDRSQACNKEQVFMVVEQMPEYKGGIKQLECDLNKVISLNMKVKEEFYFRCTVN